jgi:hypothetical protein
MKKIKCIVYVFVGLLLLLFLEYFVGFYNFEKYKKISLNDECIISIFSYNDKQKVVVNDYDTKEKIVEEIKNLSYGGIVSKKSISSYDNVYSINISTNKQYLIILLSNNNALCSIVDNRVNLQINNSEEFYNAINQLFKDNV